MHTRTRDIVPRSRSHPPLGLRRAMCAIVSCAHFQGRSGREGSVRERSNGRRSYGARSRRPTRTTARSGCPGTSSYTREFGVLARAGFERKRTQRAPLDRHIVPPSPPVRSSRISRRDATDKGKAHAGRQLRRHRRRQVLQGLAKDRRARSVPQRLGTG